MYHGVTRPSADAKPAAATEDAAPEVEKEGETGAAKGVEGAADKKERVLHTRVPAVLERELKRFAENLKVPVSNLVRAILEDAVEAADAATESVEGRLTKAAQQIGQSRERLRKKVMPDPLADVYAYQAVTMAQPAECAKCHRDLRPGEQASLGLTDAPAKSPQDRLFVCPKCLAV